MRYPIDVTVSGNVTEPNILQFAKTRSPKLVTLFGMVIEVNAVPPTAYIPIDVTLLGILIDAKEVQSPNELSPIDVMVSGNITFLKEVQPLNALWPIEVTPSGILIELKDEQL